MSSAKWIVSASRRASRDYEQILLRTMQTFGVRQTKIYETTLRQALHALSSGPDIPGVQQREDLGPGIRTLHVARKGRKGRHLIVLRIGSDRIIDVLRLLHDSMDLPSHLPP